MVSVLNSKMLGVSISLDVREMKDTSNSPEEVMAVVIIHKAFGKRSQYSEMIL